MCNRSLERSDRSRKGLPDNNHVQRACHEKEDDKISNLPPIVVNFIRKNIQSVWQLELLLYVRASKQPLSVTEIAAGLYMSPESLTTALNYFEKCGLVEHRTVHPIGYVYAPSSSALRDAFEQTAKAYSERRVAVINLIFSSPLQSLSDAFKLRPEEKWDI